LSHKSDETVGREGEAVAHGARVMVMCSSKCRHGKLSLFALDTRSGEARLNACRNERS